MSTSLNQNGEIMHKAILMLILMIASNSVFAGWTEIGSANDMIVYADSSTVRSNEDTAKIWLLYDMSVAKSIQNIQYLSEKRLNEYDCKTEEVRSYAKFLFAENMGGGEMVFSEETTTYWKLIDPGSIESVSFKIACTKFYEFWKWDWSALKNMITPQKSTTEF